MSGAGTDAGDSLQVNPGSAPPTSPTWNPPKLRRSSDDREKPSITTTTDESNVKGDAVFEQVRGGNEKVPDEEEEEEERRRQQQRQTRFIIDPAGDQTWDETAVDVVTVPCPGGHPLRSWNRDGLLSRYFGAPSMRDAEVTDDGADRLNPSWVRQGIRREADRARILLYEHPEATEGMTLSKLADHFLQELQELRDHEGAERPLIFIGHSIGGLVVKMALVKASRDPRYDNILRECYGVAYFGE